MSDLKRTCPGCGSHSSSVGHAVAYGQPCPSCGLSAGAILEVTAVRSRLGDERLKQRLEELVIENGRLTTENERLHGFFNRVQAEMVEYSEGLA